MKKIYNQFILVLTLLFLSINNQVMSQYKYCEIKFGETSGEEELENKYLKKALSNDIQNEYIFDCYPIGVEHDEHQKPILNKPIYACCQSI